jgi:hypothetical protein
MVCGLTKQEWESLSPERKKYLGLCAFKFVYLRR